MIPGTRKKLNMNFPPMNRLKVTVRRKVLGNVARLNLDIEKLNVHGGAIALGHPTGCSGARIMVSLYNALKRLDKEIGVASICGGGLTMAVILKREN